MLCGCSSFAGGEGSGRTGGTAVCGTGTPGTVPGCPGMATALYLGFFRQLLDYWVLSGHDQRRGSLNASFLGFRRSTNNPWPFSMRANYLFSRSAAASEAAKRRSALRTCGSMNPVLQSTRRTHLTDEVSASAGLRHLPLSCTHSKHREFL